MTIDKRILEDPLKAFDFLNEQVYSDTHPTSSEFIQKMRKVIEGTVDRRMQYALLTGYLMMLERDTYIAADINRMRIVCEVEKYITEKDLHSETRKTKRRR